MKKPDERISATEINKFQYCPYAWYYEKTYGRKALLEMAKDYNEKMGYESSASTNFARGNAFHQAFHKRLRLYAFLRRLVLAAVVLVALALLIAAWQGWGL